MPSLSELQHAMRARVLGPPQASIPPALADLVLPAGLSVAQRLAVHRNNVLSSLTGALREVYPVICRLVGEDFFAAAARSFILGAPPGEARLSHYGGDFVAFLGAYPAAASLPYLADVARLEWAVNEAFYAADVASLDPARLAGLAPEQSAALRFVLHPSCRLVASPYPIEPIWRANQPDSDTGDAIDLDSGGCRLLVRRHEFDVLFAPLDAGGFALLASLASGEPIAAAFGAATVAAPDFDLAGALRRHLAAGLFVDFQLGETSG